MSDEIDWPMTLGTVVLAAFLAWVVLAMYRPLHARTLDRWVRSHVVQMMAAPAAHSVPSR